MRDQEKKLRKVKEILTKDSHTAVRPVRSVSALETKDIHTPVQPTKSAATQETINIHTRVLSQTSKRVRTALSPSPRHPFKSNLFAMLYVLILSCIMVTRQQLVLIFINIYF
jgi:predicted GTPase